MVCTAPSHTHTRTHHQIIKHQHPVVRPQAQAVDEGALRVPDESVGVAVVALLYICIWLGVYFIEWVWPRFVYAVYVCAPIYTPTVHRHMCCNTQPNPRGGKTHLHVLFRPAFSRAADGGQNLYVYISSTRGCWTNQ